MSSHRRQGEMAAAKRVQIKQRLELQFGNGKQVQVPDDLLVEDWLSVCFPRIHCSHLPFLFVVQDLEGKTYLKLRPTSQHLP